MYHLWRGLPLGAATAASDMVFSYPPLASFRIWVIPRWMTVFTAQKKNAARITMIATMTEVIQVSRRLVQVILRASARTSRKNFGAPARAWTKLTFGLAGAPTPPGAAITAAVRLARSWIACGRLPDFFAMRLFKLVSRGGGIRSLRSKSALHIGWQ